jgi:hypothetical protein
MAISWGRISPIVLLFGLRAFARAKPEAQVERALIWFAPVVIGVIAALLSPGANWDLGNYHYHNAWSLLNGRFDADLAPAWIHSYLNPIEDLPFYLGNRYLPGRLVAFSMGLVQGVSFPLLYLLARRLVFRAALWRDALGAALLALLAIASPEWTLQLGSTYYDYVGSLIVLGSLVLLATPGTPAGMRWRVFAAGLMIGVTVGAKETNIAMAVGIGVALPLLARTRREAAASIVVFGIGGLLGTLAAGAFWGLFLWQRFHNPVFPYFNDIFHSPSGSLSDGRSGAHIAHGVFEYLFYPFVGYFDWPRDEDIAMWDLRFPLLNLAIPLGALLPWLTRRAPARAAPNEPPRFLPFLLVSLTVGYFVWLIGFGTMRYALTMLLLAPLVVAMVLAELPWRRLRLAIGAAMAVAVLAGSWHANRGVGDWRNFDAHMVDAVLPDVGLSASDLVLLRGESISFLSPWFPPGTSFIGSSTRSGWDGMLPDFPARMACRIAAHHGNIFAVIDSNAKVYAARYAQEIDLAAYGLRIATSRCRPIRSTQRAPGLDLLCPVERVGAPAASASASCSDARQ